MILERFIQLVESRGLAGRLPSAGETGLLAPLPGSAPSGVAGALTRVTGGPVVLVAPTPGRAEAAVSDLQTLAAELATGYFPQREALPFEDADPHVEITGQRVETLARLLAGDVTLLVTTARALSERSPLPAPGDALGLTLAEGDRVGRDELADRLEEMGFERVHTVEELGEYAVRGGIVDIFPFATEEPVRVELWDEEVASLRAFDLLDQRSTESLSSVEVLPVELEAPGAPEAGDGASRRSLLELLPDRTLFLRLDPRDGDRRRARQWEETVEARSTGTRGGELTPEQLLLPPDEARRRLSRRRQLLVGEEAGTAPGGDGDPGSGAGRTDDEPALDLGVESPPVVEREMSRLVDAIAAGTDRGDRVVLLCDNRGQIERLEEILEERGGKRLVEQTTLALGSLAGGFRLPEPASLLVLTDHEIFQRTHRVRRTRRTHGSARLESIASLQPGDYVVHLDHGIGRFRGLERVEVGGEGIETLKIEYADGEALRVPHYRLDLIEKYSVSDGEGTDVKPPRVHKLGGKRWKKLKDRTVDSIQETAAELLELYAHRQVADGHAFPEDTKWQKEMESAFLYEETPDQQEAWEEVKADLEEPRPMDRLICGDVGYGKTEVAMRAAFKAVQDSKQVAVLAPTTVLVEQHLHTFRERLAGFPVRIEALSRFQKRSKQDAVLDGLEVGSVDIVVGTHRLLSDDVDFHDLGLLVVDEEQRFGVRQKEKLKQYKRSVDVLTMTATPIPRTLQLALGGLRDLSVIETPPRNRLPVITHVLRWSDPILRDAMRRELDRGGQVFFVHDRVETIDTLAARVRNLVPDATVEVAHGQMPERELELTMARLMEGDVDVLVSTSIVENGLDVPTANTMIVHQAQMFGLSQLYQLRGRVGRSHHRAYCYLLVPEDVTPEAEQRLRVLEHHTELGAGYQVALKDLELRGAGNLLGARQSGFAQAVGFETYRRLLEKTVARMKGEDGEGREPPQVSVEGEAFLPDDYILDPEQKMHLYRRISRVDDRREVDELREELRDRFGPLPEPVERLLTTVELQTLGAALGTDWIRVSDGSVRINFREGAVPRMRLLRDAFHDRQLSVEVRRSQPLSLILEQAGVEPVLPTLVDALAVLSRTEEAGARAAAG